MFDNKNFEGHESVHLFSDKKTGLKAIIAIHNTARGPAAGGTRFWSYPTEKAAMEDALNLSRAMSFKNAMADIPFGGGKAVILRPEAEFDRSELFKVYGRAVESLGGIYRTAEDVGVTTADMENVHTQTAYVGGLDKGNAASGDPSPITAEGVFRCLKIAANNALGAESLDGLKVAVQGLGHVGYSLCEKLAQAGVHLFVADINEAVVQKAQQELGVKVVSTNVIHTAPVDIFAPCALGGAINPDSIQDLKAKIVGGAANNQLLNPEMGEILRNRGILYCPDYVINGGGIINVAAELSGTYDPEWVDGKLNGLTQTLSEIFTIAESENRPTNEVADRLARQRLKAAA